MDEQNVQKLLKIKKQLEELTNKVDEEIIEIQEARKTLLKEQKPKKILLKANEQVERQ